MGRMLDRHMQHRRQQTLQDLPALLQNHRVQAAASGRGAVDDLAAEHIDPIEGQREEFQPSLLHIYSHRPVVMAAVAVRRLGVPPKPRVKELVFQQGEHLGPEHDKLLTEQFTLVETQNPANKRLPSLPIFGRKAGFVIPGAIERVKGDRTVEQPAVGLVAGIDLLCPLQPTQGPVDADLVVLDSLVLGLANRLETALQFRHRYRESLSNLRIGHRAARRD
jgi:hypothetical protein